MRRIDAAALAATPARLIVRRAWWAYLPLAVMLAAGAAFWGALAWHVEWELARAAFALPFALVLALVLLVVTRIARLRGAANWVVRVTDNAVMLNACHDAALGGIIVELPFTEIRSVRRVVEKRLGVGDHSIEDVHDRHVYLEIAIEAADTSPLASCRPPVRLHGTDVLRIGWRDHATLLTPSIATFVATLPPTIVRLPDERSDWREARTLSEPEFEARVRALCDGNDRIGAIKVVRVRYGVGLREARERVDRLAS